MEDVLFETGKRVCVYALCVVLCLCALPFVAPLLMNCQQLPRPHSFLSALSTEVSTKCQV